MKKKTSYRKAPRDIAAAIDEARLIKDFLPSPEKLVPKDDSIKITLFLSKKSVNFFKKRANMFHVPYQKMMRRVLDLYASHF